MLPAHKPHEVSRHPFQPMLQVSLVYRTHGQRPREERVLDDLRFTLPARTTIHARHGTIFDFKFKRIFVFGNSIFQFQHSSMQGNKYIC